MNFKKYSVRKNLHYNNIFFTAFVFAFAAALICVSVTLQGCAAAPPQTAAEEIKLFEWVRTEEKGGANEQLGYLVFTENGISLTSVQGENRLDLTGECVIEESTVTVISENYGTVVMGYTLSSDKLTLSYSGKGATFVKR